MIQYMILRINVAVLAEISLRSPRKLFIFIIKDNYMIKVSQKRNEKIFTASHPSWWNSLAFVSLTAHYTRHDLINVFTAAPLIIQFCKFSTTKIWIVFSAVCKCANEMNGFIVIHSTHFWSQHVNSASFFKIKLNIFLDTLIQKTYFFDNKNK